MMNASSCVSVTHVYQRTLNGHLLFYTISDFLVFFTIFCREAKRWNMHILGVCPMYDHIHVLVEKCDSQSLYRFVQAYTRQYAGEFNLSIGSKGSIFKETFGRAEKYGTKEVRSACSYLYNNPGEKMLCERSEDYRWTFLAYAKSRHPFSIPLILSKAPSRLRKAIKIVNYYHSIGKYLSHPRIETLFRCLSLSEKQQLIDYIITIYNCIDYDRLFSLYGSYDQACLAFASNQGNEFSIHEEFTPGSHKAYINISQFLIKKLGFKRVKDVFLLSEEQKRNLAQVCYKMNIASSRQIEKYFRGMYLSDNQ